ncbi:uncharacterized protein LOC135948540 isoform X3 [Cloeon dipterum]|uniref:uncharacterized protein LOC135948540 isoform X3 n=1 Tax=Cloeon dipterum TaxID=197152 RepID=UPI0032207101
MKTFLRGKPSLRPDTMSDRGGVQPLTETQLAVKSISVESLPPVIDFDTTGYEDLENITKDLQDLLQAENYNFNDVQQIEPSNSDFGGLNVYSVDEVSKLARITPLADVSVNCGSVSVPYTEETRPTENVQPMDLGGIQEAPQPISSVIGSSVLVEGGVNCGSVSVPYTEEARPTENVQPMDLGGIQEAPQPISSVIGPSVLAAVGVNCGSVSVPYTEEARPTENVQPMDLGGIQEAPQHISSVNMQDEYARRSLNEESIGTMRVPLQEINQNETTQDPELQAKIKSMRERIQDLCAQIQTYNGEAEKHLNEIGKKREDQAATITHNHQIVKDIQDACSAVAEKLKKEEEQLKEKEERKKQRDNAEDVLKQLLAEKKNIDKNIEDKRRIISSYKKFNDQGCQQRVKQYQDEIKSKKEKLKEMQENKSYVDDLNQSLKENDAQYEKLKKLAIAAQRDFTKRAESEIDFLKKELNTATKPKKRSLSLSKNQPLKNKRAKLTEDSTGDPAVPSTSRAHDSVDMGSLQPSVTDRNPTQKDVPEATSTTADESIPKKIKKRIEAQSYKEQIEHLGILTSINTAIRVHAGLDPEGRKYSQLNTNVNAIAVVRKAETDVLRATMTALQKQHGIKRKDLKPAADKFLENLEIKPRKGFEKVDECVNTFAMKLATTHKNICSLFRDVAHKLKNQLDNDVFEEFSEYCKDTKNQLGEASAPNQVGLGATNRENTPLTPREHEMQRLEKIIEGARELNSNDSQIEELINLEPVEGPRDGAKSFKITSRAIRTLEQFKMRYTKCKVEVLNIKPQPQMSFLLALVDCAEYMIEDVHNLDFIGFVISTNQDQTLTIPFIRRGQFSPEVITNQVQSFAQSAREFVASNSFQLDVIVAADLHGGGGRFKQNLNATEQRSIVTSKNHKRNGMLSEALRAGKFDVNIQQKMCVLFAVVTGKKFCEYKEKLKIVGNDPNANQSRKIELDNEWKDVTKQQSRDFVNDVMWFLKNLNLSLEEGAGTEHLKRIQQLLGNDYKLIVYSGHSNESRSFGSAYSPGDESKKHIYLAYDQETHHYDMMKNPASYLLTRIYCTFCEKGLFNERHTDCPGSKCTKCNLACKSDVRLPEKRKCDDCNFEFLTNMCFEGHKEHRKCEERKICRKCCLLIDYKLLNGKNHICNTRHCQNCEKFVKLPHVCYIRKPRPSKNLEEKDSNTLITFADFECTQHDEVLADNRDGVRRIHRVNLVCSQTVCKNCRDREINDEDPQCEVCGMRELCISNINDPNLNVVKAFLEMLNEKSSGKHRPDNAKGSLLDHVCLFHNLKGYDGVLILNEILRSNKWTVKSVILNGLTVMQLEIVYIESGVRITFKDFINFVPCSLSKLPKAFKLSNDLAKGYFPHLFNRPENYTYREKRLPALEFYDPTNMGVSQYEAFIAWYEKEVRRLEESEDEVFDFPAEIVKYCKNDVTILRQAALQFSSFFETYACSPFLESITIASLVSLLYRRNFYKPKSIGLIPRSDSYRTTQSKEALMYFRYLETEQNLVNLKHAGNGQEEIVGGYPVDALDTSTNTVYQYMGDYWHFCPDCYPDDEKANFEAKKQYESGMARRQATFMRTRTLEKLNYKVVEMYGCKFKALLKDQPQVKERLLKDPIVQKGYLHARNCLSGGRTNSVILWHECGPDEEINYYDFTSLYPTTQKYCEYIVGHPTVYTTNFPSLDSVKGFVFCRVLPPDSLYHPVLPQKVGDKLLFHLCKKCAAQKNHNSPYCTHTDEERSFDGSWSSWELNLARKFGYKITEIYEIWHYEKTTKYKKDEDEGLFTSFVNAFLKLKQEASGWPENNMSSEDKKKYIESYAIEESIDLDESKIEKNEVIRTVAKLCLNSLWGKFGQNARSKTAIIEDRSRLLELLSAPNVTVTNIMCDATSKVVVQYNDDQDTLNNVNVLVAALTTSHARIMLYQLLHILGKKVLAFDTDSVIYTQKKGTPLLKTGRFLGCLTDEVAEYGEGSKITKYASLGPKNYCFVVQKPDGTCKEVRKCKGITLKQNNIQETSMESIEKLLNGEVDEINIQIHNKIQRSSDFQIYSEDGTKKMRLVYDKRALISKYETIPWGTKRGAKEPIPDENIVIDDWNIRNHIP